MAILKVQMYSKPGCCLCDEAKEVIENLRKGRQIPAFDFDVVDISQSPELLLRYGEQIPVVFIDGQKAFKFRVDPAKFVQKLTRNR